MNKILLVIQREYFTRIQKKSFWIASLLGPLLITAIYAVPIWLAMQDKEVKRVEILDESGLFQTKDLVDKEVEFKLVNKPAAELKSTFSKDGFTAFVHLPSDILAHAKDIKIYSEKNLSLPLKSSIERVIEKKVRAILMKDAGIASEVYEKTQIEVSSETITVSEKGDETSSSSGGAMILAGVMGMLLYITLLLYGSQVMNGVIEEKSSRIIEVIISSIKPYQLFLIFNELVDGMDAKGMNHAKDLGWMIDASHNVKDPLEDLLQSVEAIQIAYAQALLVDRSALEAAREANDVVRCQEILQAVFRTDVRALVAQARLELGGALDPIALFRQEKMRDQLIKARGAKTVATGL